MIDEAKKVMNQQFKVKDLGELRFFLGIEVLRSQQGIMLNQRKYTLELISELGLSGAKPVVTSLEINQKLTSVEYDKGVGMQVEDPMVDVTGYQKLIGKLLYLTVTRQDISYVVQTLSQFMQAPKKSHMDAALRVVRYLKAAPGMGVLMHREPKDTLPRFCDSDWAACPVTRRSVSGYVVKFGNFLIS
ncbi:PREDICTED: uncharacterized protein LOC109208297 [Nicotiana attenuata]|uniref:uncharacterized protein LOC109208297 n=1 Tax=Nicotiana attenuata TaxID=49451 RepID=UPI00090463F9|nr:PREDICTED: uncharacterized protein LOC109208297 [Nicotiana attenuata]